MIDKEINKLLRQKYGGRRAARKSKLKSRFGHCLAEELARTWERLELLEEIGRERN